ncbi:MAG: hypothetical protein HC875_38925 [Anaerolineales bacterium]|nr:hypothetical protein [Anaerolineales bacterium]
MKLSSPFSLPPFQSSSLPTCHPSNLPRSLQGVILALASSACIAVTFIASKQAMQELSPLAFTPVWFAVASAWGISVYLWQQGPKLPPGLRESFRPIFVVRSFKRTVQLFVFYQHCLGRSDPGGVF